MRSTIVLLTIWHLSYAQPQGEIIPSQQESISRSQSQLPLQPVEPARPAQCRVRPEVQEITRALIDSSSASFLIWPSCVEVQRCSGCCNTRNYQCQPIKQQARTVLITKKSLEGRKLVSSGIEVTLIDDVECQCVRTSGFQSRLVAVAPSVREVVVPRKRRRHHRKLHKYKDFPASHKESMFT